VLSKSVIKECGGANRFSINPSGFYAPCSTVARSDCFSAIGDRIRSEEDADCHGTDIPAKLTDSLMLNLTGE